MIDSLLESISCPQSRDWWVVPYLLFDLLWTNHWTPSTYPWECISIKIAPCSFYQWILGMHVGIITYLLFHSQVFTSKWIVSVELNPRTSSNIWVWFRWPNPAPQDWHWFYNLILWGVCRKSLNGFWLRMTGMVLKPRYKLFGPLPIRSCVSCFWKWTALWP